MVIRSLGALALMTCLAAPLAAAETYSLGDASVSVPISDTLRSAALAVDGLPSVENPLIPQNDVILPTLGPVPPPPIFPVQLPSGVVEVCDENATPLTLEVAVPLDGQPANVPASGTGDGLTVTKFNVHIAGQTVGLDDDAVIIPANTPVASGTSILVHVCI